MPQMAPTWWTLMYLTFISSVIIMCIILYFHSFNMPSTKQQSGPSKKSINWKW
uniref:ATP synthase complex subunit 8 n=1 Tax=Paratriatoma lecticularia TaxID=2994058 RepID=A0A7D7JRA1_9HEMI|nr:ATP synthase F0 subunit 8 [Paratriatoma lecticularia]QMP96802.1 ATP synthase F0 subunit 8 [Paratriatoma lecticularia]